MTQNALAFLIVGILLGALPGFLIGQSLNVHEIDDPDTPEAESLQVPETYPIPQSMSECYVAIAQASTDRGARYMENYCYKKYGDEF